VTRIGQCNACGRCCLGIKLESSEPITDTESLEWFAARGVRIIDGGHTICIDNLPCPHLTAENLCDLQRAGKPQSCRGFPFAPRDILQGCGYGFEEDGQAEGLRQWPEVGHE